MIMVNKIQIGYGIPVLTDYHGIQENISYVKTLHITLPPPAWSDNTKQVGP